LINRILRPELKETAGSAAIRNRAANQIQRILPADPTPALWKMASANPEPTQNGSPSTYQGKRPVLFRDNRPV
jgi:hypothetical protein